MSAPAFQKIYMPQPKKFLSFFDVLGFAAGYWRRQPKTLALVLAMLLTAAGLESYLPTALAAFLNAIRVQADHATVRFTVGIFLGTYLAQTCLGGLAYMAYNAFETRIFKMLVDDVYAHVQRLPEHFFVNTFTGSIISKITRGRRQIETLEDQIILKVFTTFSVLAGSTVFLALHFPLLALLMVIYLVTLFGVVIFLAFVVSGPAQGVYAAAQDIFSGHLADSLSGMATIKSYAQEVHELSQFLEVTEGLRRDNARAYIFSQYCRLIQRLLLAGMLALLLGGGVWYYFHGKATPESLAYLAFAYTIMQSYIQTLGDNIQNILTSSYDLHAVINLLREPAEPQNQIDTSPLDIREGAIVFDHVGFTYPGKTTPVFENLCVSIRAGERVALVGHSGSGKTSFVRLLQCLYAVQSGHIAIDGQDITEGSRNSLRKSIALVPQDPVLFHRSLQDNIAYAKPGASLDDVRNAARQAHIADFIESLPLKYDTLVGERGIKLSGGERQRIAIARAILADRPILILDEATSSLDSASERAIQEALYSLTHGRTSIMIAHRLSTILDADRILVFDNGRIVEEGTHDELLLKPDGLYAGFFKLQSGVFIED